MWRPNFSILVLAIGLAGAAYLAPTEVEACGGTFCDGNQPGSMPVDQTGETILFALDNGYVEAHVQIEYDGGTADQFAWLVPVPEIPEIEVGSWRLVQAALDGTRPIYGFEDNVICEDLPPPGNGSSFIQDPDGGGVSVGDPEVVAEDVVGAFQYAILQGGSADTVTEWLVAHDYAVDEEAPIILDDYIAEGHVFVAFRLRHGQGVEDIHPVVIRYPGSEPCIPIRLTRVAAKDDMDIRALFLGEARVVSTNYQHVLLNRTQLNWLSQGTNYRDLVTLAIDTPGADGRAFVTEYAGASDVIDPSTLDTSSYDVGALADISVVDVIDVLASQEVLSCDQDGCLWQHELASSLVHEFLPVPEGVDEGQFYSCLSCYAGLIDMEAWDPEAFAAAYQERIVAPLEHAQQLLETWPYVTRLYTTISPHEMTSDPMFAEDPTLEDVANRHGARRDRECCGDMMRLPGGRTVWMPGNQWPVWDDSMPWAERVLEYPPGGGAPVVLVDNTALIDDVLDHWNALSDCVDSGTGGLDTGGSMGGADGPGSAGTTGGSDTGSNDGGLSGGLGDSPTGCGCTSAPAGLAWMWMLLGLGLGAVRRRSA